MDFETDFLDPYEEFEMRYAEEMELLREMEDDDDAETNKKASKKSLNFDDIPSSSGVSVTLSESQSQKCNSLVEQLSPLPLAELDTSISHPSNAVTIAVSEEAGCSHSVKRTAEDLFGDIDDLDFCEKGADRPNGNVKRSRIEVTKTNEVDPEDELIISRIMERRKLKEGSQANCFDVYATTNNQTSIFDCSLTRRVPKWAFITLRNGKNEKFYTKLHSDEFFNNKVASVSEECKNLRLLSIPFQDVMLEANAILDKKFSDQEKALQTAATSSHESSTDVTELWVQKYKPVTYLDLLSDEGTNRTLLKWIKLWDKIVFNREPKIRSKSKPQNNNWNQKNYDDLDEELDESGCPKYKIVLLCGPPGLGKTTLAHLVAKHAGYNVVEMNASDDRSPEKFKIQLEAATQMKAVLGRNPKPNCLVIDEIDGAPAPSIDVLIKFVKGEMKTKSKKKVTKASVTLRRPIICICNDMYVPALRALRQMAFVIHFPPTSLSRLASRLVEIARAEKIKTDIGAMTTLCEKANNDIRTCLSTMYCLKDQPIGLMTIRNTNVGLKDMQKGLFTVWQEIFQIPVKKMENDRDFIELKKKYKTDQELFMARRWHSILRSVQGNSDYDRLAQGVYENFLSVKFNDSCMKKVSQGLEWFCFMDEMKTSVLSSQVYTLMAYMPYCFVMWGFLFSVYQRTKINFPSLMFELHTRRTKYSQIVEEVLKGMDPCIRAYCHYEPLLLDTLPYFTYILNPILRPVSIQLFSNAEKEALRQLVYTMIDYNLNFVQERTQSGSYEFSMDPNIEEVIEFPDSTKVKNLTYSLKMMIAQEIEQEKLRRLESSLWKQCDMSTSVPEELLQDTPTEAAEPEPIRSQNHLQKLTPKLIKKSPASSVTKDFFGRIVDPATVKKTRNEKVDDILKSDIWFHFKEGFSNAVRRSVYMKDLL